MPSNALRRLPIVLLLGLACLLAPGRAAALDPSKRLTQYILETWEVEQGLPQSSITAMVQTRDGYLWLGTQEGLARFDGMQFTPFDKRNTRGFPNNHITALLEARDGSLWAGTYGGIVHYREGAFRFYTTADGLPHEAVLSLAQDGRGTVWAGTEEGGLCRFTGGKFEAVRWDPAPEGSVHAILETRDGAFWVGATSGLYRFQQGGSVRRWTRKEGMPATVVLCLREGHDGTLWVGTSGGGVCAFDGNAFTVRDTKSGLAYNVVESLAEDADGNLWVGTFQGLTRFHGNAASSMGLKEGLSDDVILSLLPDREGNLWVGTSNGGLNRLRTGFITPWSVREGLSADDTYCVLEDRSGAVWIGTKSGGLNVLRDGRVATYTVREGLPDNDVVALLEARDGALWIGTDEGIARLNGGAIVRVAPKDIGRATITCLMEDREGALWMGSDGGGLYRMKGGAVRAFTSQDGLADASILSMAQSPDGALWFGTDGGGLHRYREGGRFTVYGTKEGLSNGMVMTLLAQADGTLWVGTYGGGLNRLRDGRLTACTTEHGLFDDNIFSILDDGHGSLWMSSNLGIFTVPLADLDAFMDGRRERIVCRSFGAADGMRSRECNGGSNPSGWRGRDGRLWFTTVRGVAVLDPRLLARAPALSVQMEAMAVNGRTIVGSYLAGPLAFKPGHDAFEFHYTAPGYPVPDRIRFRYRLAGHDRDWIEAGARRAAYYTNLKPGAYAFMVEAAAADGPWSAVRQPVRFTLLPRYYERPLFWAACLAALGFLAWGAYRWRIRRMERRERELAALVDARTRDLLEATQKLEEKTWLADQLSRSDGLTGLANRRCFDEFLEDEWKRSSRAGMDLSLLMIDLDYFKDYNDARGHQAGDDCLRRVTRCVQEIMHRGGDLVARYGGEEFVVVLFNTGAEGAAVVAEKLRAAVEDLAIPHGASAAAPVVTISVGHATLRPREEGTPAMLVAAADRALYAAKAAGRNCVRGGDEG